MNRKLIEIIALAVCASAPAVRAATIEIDLQYSPIGAGIFQYELSVINNGPSDVAIVSIVDAPADEALLGATLVAPGGFMALYDPTGAGLGFGFVDLFEGIPPGSALFAANSTTSGFTFQSTFTPRQNFTLFEALTVDGEPLSGEIRFQAVPEAGTTLLLTALGSLSLGLAHRKISVLS